MVNQTARERVSMEGMADRRPPSSEPPLARGLGRAVASRREELGMSSATLAARSRLSEAELADIEKGAAFPSPVSLAAVAQALGLTAEGLAERAEATAAKPRPRPVERDRTADILRDLRRLLARLEPDEAEAVLLQALGEQRIRALGGEDPRREGVRVAGVDACRGGWVLATGQAEGDGPTSVRVVGSFGEIVGMVKGGLLAAVGVDIPIGLPEAGSRACDITARELIGPRRSSVFPAPIRGVLDAPTWSQANDQAKQLHGKGLARQTFGLLAKIREVDELINPDLQDAIVEVHPEVSFAVLSGRPLDAPKHGAEGRSARRMALEREFPDIRRHAAVRLRGAASDDVLDAYAVLWTARRFFRGEDRVLGDGARDTRGLRMEIVV
jgi:predicted RNase H-like nuclease/transcriptional regulator with XRE-family HTH domain